MKTETKSSIAGKVVIVTGASSGIGEATAWEFGQLGAKTVLTARRAERLERLAKKIRTVGGTALPVPTDLTDEKQISNLVRETLSNFGRIDILVNIAGWGHYDWFEELTHYTLRQQFEVNILGMAELIRQVLPAMKAQRSGIIVNMSSYSSKISVPPLTVYSSTKYAVEGLSDGLRRELAPWGIKVIRIHPSAVTGTEFKEKAVANGGVEYSTVPIGQVSREEVAKAIVKLVEDPQPSLFLGRVYDVPAITNLLFPWLIDWISTAWVKKERRNELQKPPRGNHKTLPVAVQWTALAAASVLVLGWLVKKKW
jgi:NADP-dependent 3-hydroxy acid dehydrogenase YdfG